MASLKTFLLKSPFKAQLPDDTQTLNSECQTYFSQVLAHYQLLPPTAAPTAEEIELRKFADIVVAKKPAERTRADLFALEICVVKLLPELDLRRGAWAIRCKYRDLAGPKDFDAYQASNPPDPKTGNVDELRADCLKILGEFHWIYAFTPVRERKRESLVKEVFRFTLFLTVLALILAAYGYYHEIKSGNTVTQSSVPILPIIIAMGMVGGYVSLQRRIQSVPSTGDPIVSIAELSNSKFSVYLAPVSGAVFAVLLYIVFIGGLLKGPLFPVISSPDGECEYSVPAKTAFVTASATTSNSAASVNTAPANVANLPNSVATDTVGDKTERKCVQTIAFTGFVKHTGPASGAQFALLLIWAFIAGFAERFVPDTIDRLVSQAAQK